MTCGAITKPERLARWFGAVSGDLRLGGSFQIKDNAKGEVTECKPPEMLAVTWKMYGDVGWVRAHLSPSNGGTKTRDALAASGRIQTSKSLVARTWPCAAKA
jgi:uncharacterized protein YndB with AHSA1/START domain